MFETPFTIVGNIVNDPVHRSVGEQEVVKFRVASNSRRRNADGTWEPGNSLFVTVNCWGRLVAGVSTGLVKGDPVVVVGHVYTSEYDDKEGNRRSSVEVRATSVGRISCGAPHASIGDISPSRLPSSPRPRSSTTTPMRRPTD